MTARPDAAIRALRVAAYRVPADAPEADGTFPGTPQRWCWSNWTPAA